MKLLWGTETWADFRYEVGRWLRRWRLLWAKPLSPEDLARWKASVQGLVDALKQPYFWEAHTPCPLHPKNLSTPYGPRCCYNPVLQVEDLSPVMQNVQYNENAIKLWRKS